MELWLSQQKHPIITGPEIAMYYVEYVPKWAQMTLMAQTGAEDLEELLNWNRYKLIVSYDE